MVLESPLSRASSACPPSHASVRLQPPHPTPHTPASASNPHTPTNRAVRSHGRARTQKDQSVRARRSMRADRPKAGARGPERQRTARHRPRTWSFPRWPYSSIMFFSFSRARFILNRSTFSTTWLRVRIPFPFPDDAGRPCPTLSCPPPPPKLPPPPCVPLDAADTFSVFAIRAFASAISRFCAPIAPTRVSAREQYVPGFCDRR
eukprot:2859023-Rhodomonas_salina.2